MILKDALALKELKRVRSCDLEDDIADYPENERDGRSDLEILADEVSYILSCSQEYGHARADDLEAAKDILRRTNYGHAVPMNAKTLKPIYQPFEVQAAKERVNEYNRLKSCMKRLNNMGFYGRWF